jgi:glycine C-acetyltransferase
MIIAHKSAENFSLADVMKLNDKGLQERLALFQEMYLFEAAKEEALYRREIVSMAGREAVVLDPYSGKEKTMLMFGSNNYLGLASHPYIMEKITGGCESCGPGLGGPPLLNGYTSLHRELEQKLAILKGKEEAMLFSSGYMANFGLATALLNRKTMVILDEYSHASFLDGIIMSRSRFKFYAHNDMRDLKRLLDQTAGNYSDVFVSTEGVFSMDGDMGNLEEIIKLKQEYKFMIILDDAHGLGVLGAHGHGAHEAFAPGDIDIIMGTFSKTLAAAGGFLAADSLLIGYLRFMTRAYMFSASLPPAAINQVLAGLELIDKEGWRVKKLRENAAYLQDVLKQKGITVNKTDSAIVTIIIPAEKNIRKIGKRIHDAGIFLNTVEYPAVSKEFERLRISVMANHSTQDLDKLAEVLGTVLR